MPEYRVAALEKGLRILDTLSQMRQAMSLSDISDRSGLPVSTAFRLVRTLLNDGYLLRVDGGKYRLGPSAVLLGVAALEADDMVGSAAGPLRRLTQTTGHTTNLGVLNGSRVLYLDRVQGRGLVTSNVGIGSTLPSLCTSMGKVLLACSPTEVREKALAGATLAECDGPRAPSSLAAVLESLSDIRKQRWALQDEEISGGLRSVAAPILNAESDAVAAINLVVGASVCTAAQLQERYLPLLLATADEISGHVRLSGMVTQQTQVVPDA